MKPGSVVASIGAPGAFDLGSSPGRATLFNFKYKHHILKFYPTFLSRVLWINPQHSHSGDETENFIWNYLKKDDIFIDIGANIGTTTLEASKKIGVDGRIFS